MNKFPLLLIILFCFGCAVDKNETPQIDNESMSELTARLKENLKYINQKNQDSISLNLSITNKEVIQKQGFNIVLVETVTEDGRFYQSVIGIIDTSYIALPTYIFSNTGKMNIKIKEITDLESRLQIAASAEFENKSSDFNLYFDKAYDGSKDPFEFEIK